MNRMTLSEFKKLKRGNKYHAKKIEADGVIFDSKSEHEFYQLLKADKSIAHIDVHPTVTLPGGIRYKPDFIIYPRLALASHYPTAIEVKGAITESFKILRKLFDSHHPLRPLQVWRKVGKKWEAI